MQIKDLHVHYLAFLLFPTVFLCSTNVMTYLCKECTFETSVLRQYVRHYRLHRNVPNIVFPCCQELCVRQFHTYSTFRAHVLRDHGRNTNTSQSRSVNGQTHVNVHLVCRQSFCDSTFSRIEELLKYLRQHLDRRDPIVCPFRSCNTKIVHKSTFSSHISRKHKHHTLSELSDSVLEANNTHTNTDEGQRCISLQTDNRLVEADLEESETGDADLDETTQNQYLKNIAQFYLKLEAKHLLLPVSLIQDILTEYQSLHELSNNYVESQIIERLQSNGISDEIIDDIRKDMSTSDIFSMCNKGPLRSAKCMSTFYKHNFPYVPPEEVVLGFSEESGRERTFQYVPILKTSSNIYTYHRSHMSSPIDSGEQQPRLQDIHQGSLYKDNEFFQTHMDSFQIILYQDAFEVVNQLGSAKKKHKLVGVLNHFGENEKDVFFVVDETASVGEVEATTGMESLLLLVFGDSVLAGKSYMLMCDRMVISSMGRIPSFMDAFSAFFASFYLFNLEYPPAVSATMEFIQRCFIGINPDRGSKGNKGKRRRFRLTPRYSD